MNSKDKHTYDLENHLHSNVVKNQSSPVGEHCYLTVNGLEYEYFHDQDLFIVERLAKRMKSDIGWFEKISSHAPSIGSFYESLVQSAINEILPSSLKLGSGFVYDSAKKDASPQIDFIIYSDKSQAPIYKRDSFVVVDSSTVISCVEVKKTLTKQIIRNILETYTNVNLGTSPLCHHSIQYLNIFAFHSKLSIDKAFECLSIELTKYFATFRYKTVSGATANAFIYNLVLPRIFFFDKTGYISCVCRPTKDNTFDIVVQMCSSSLAGHSLGEFLVSISAANNNEQKISQKNFLTFPLIIVEKEIVLFENISIVRKLSMDDIVEIFPSELDTLKDHISNMKRKPYGAIVSVALNIKNYTLKQLERTKDFRWLISETDTPPGASL